MTETTGKTAPSALPVVNARIYPKGGLDILSRDEVARQKDASSGGMHDLLRRCALAVLTSGSASDDPRAAQELYPDFDIQVQQQDRGIKIELSNAPAMAFVDGEIIRGVAELLFAVVRDLAFTAIEHYRLRQEDYDGKFDHSPVISVQGPKSLIEAMNSPNPVYGRQIRVELTGHIAPLRLELIDAGGRRIPLVFVMLDQAADVALPYNLTAGVYYLSAVFAEEVLTVPLVMT